MLKRLLLRCLLQATRKRPTQSWKLQFRANPVLKTQNLRAATGNPRRAVLLPAETESCEWALLKTSSLKWDRGGDWAEWVSSGTQLVLWATCSQSKALRLPTAAEYSPFSRIPLPAPNSQKRSSCGHGLEWHSLCFVPFYVSKVLLAEALVLSRVVFETVKFSTIKDGLILLTYVFGLVSVWFSCNGFAAFTVDAVFWLRLAWKCLCDVHE